MSNSPKDYPIQLSEAQIEHIQTLMPDQISVYLHGLELSAGLRVRDSLNPDVIHEVQQPEPAVRAAATAASKVSVTVSGLTFSGTQAEVDAQMLAYFRAANARGELQTTNDTAPRNSDGTFRKQTQEHELSADEATKLRERAQLDLQWRTGQISTEAYMERTGIFETYAREKLGIETDPTRREQKENEQIASSWQAATEAFLQGPGNDWPGGEQNKERLKNKIIELNLTDNPSAESLHQAFLAIKAEDATTPEQMREALGINDRARNSTLFGRGTR
jgi:hypothetical protein